METVRQVRATRPVPPAPKVEKTADKGGVNLAFQVLKFSLDADDEERIVTGAVLVPDKIDAHGDLIPADVIRKAALDFGFRLNSAPEGEETSVAGIQHTDFTKTETIRVVESYLAPVNFEMNGVTVFMGSWVVSVKVLDDDVWQDVKNGKITGFSMGGHASVSRTELGMKVAQAAETAEVPYAVVASQFVHQARMAYDSPEEQGAV